MKTTLFSLTILIVALSITSLVNQKKHPLLQFETTKDFVEIPAGPVRIKDVQQEVKAFAIAKYEVTNRQYREFLEDLKNQNKTEVLQLAQFRIDQWQQTDVDTALQNVYHTYQGFDDFPVVNITRQGAELYCQWLTEKLKKEQKSGKEVVFRLPTRQEWIRAARGENLYATYAWGRPYLIGANGYFLCNFRRIGSERIHFDETTQSYEVILSEDKMLMLMDKVDAYAPNDFGLYNVCGNVAEMIAEPGKAVGGSWHGPGYDVRVESIQNIPEASPYVGFRPVMVITEK